MERAEACLPEGGGPDCLARWARVSQQGHSHLADPPPEARRLGEDILSQAWLVGQV